MNPNRKSRARQLASAACLDFAAAAQWVRDNPRASRTLPALLDRSRTREQIDRISGSSNGPNLISTLRNRLGLEIPCVMTPTLDRDGLPTRRGEYQLTEGDKEIVRALMRELAKVQAGDEAAEMSSEELCDSSYLSLNVLERAVRRWLDNGPLATGGRAWLTTLLRDFDATELSEVRPADRKKFFHHLISVSRLRTAAAISEAK